MDHKFSIEKINESKKPLHGQHLEKGFSPIITCVGASDDFYEEMESIENIYRYRDDNDISNVNYFESVDILNNENFRNSGIRTYVISPVDNKNKLSDGFKNCTGIAIVGTDKETGDNISILTHQDPHKFLESYKAAFEEDLHERLKELKDRSVKGSIDGIVFGGNYFTDESRDKKFRKDYLESVKLLSENIKKEFGFEPVITGPKTVSGSDDVILDTENRRMYLLRPEETKATKVNEPYLASGIDDQKTKWH